MNIKCPACDGAGKVKIQNHIEICEYCDHGKVPVIEPLTDDEEDVE